MPHNEASANTLKPVSPATLAMIDDLRDAIEEDVAMQCIANDNPVDAMGPEAEPMIRTGLRFVSKMLRAMMTYGADKIMEDELGWGRTRLPVNGVSMEMVLKNFERYAGVLEKKLTPATYIEVRPYLTVMIRLQRSFAKETDGNAAG